jgi:hypothetical protein
LSSSSSRSRSRSRESGRNNRYIETN